MPPFSCPIYGSIFPNVQGRLLDLGQHNIYRHHMPETPILTFYLHRQLRKRAEAGSHNFINKIKDVVEKSGFEVAFEKQDDSSLRKSASRPGYAMFHMGDPFHQRALTMRRAYQYPFWAIEKTSKRWDWDVAKTKFPVCEVNRKEAEGFYKFWRKRQFGEAAAKATRQGFVYLPLQGKLQDHRSFQTCSPLQMVEHVLENDPIRPVVVSLHPGESYTPSELSALESLAFRHPRISIQMGGMADLLATCDYVVTQNSSVAYFGYFFAKPAVLFGQIDFHHISANVIELGVKNAMAMGPQLEPDYSGYVHWFWQKMSINGGREDATDKIRSKLLAAGWPI